MNLKLGLLDFTLAIDHPQLLSLSASSALPNLKFNDRVGVAEIDPKVSDTVAFCEKYGIGMSQAANCVILEAARAEKSWFAACVVLASTKADINGLARRTLDARRVSFAPMEQAVSITGMEYGAITPVGLPSNWIILIDKAVVDAKWVIIGSGIRKSKLAVAGSFLAQLPNVQILEGLGQAKNINIVSAQ